MSFQPPKPNSNDSPRTVSENLQRANISDIYTTAMPRYPLAFYMGTQSAQNIKTETQPGVETQQGSSPATTSQLGVSSGLQKEPFPGLKMGSRLKLGAPLEAQMRARAELGLPPEFPLPRPYSVTIPESQSGQQSNLSFAERYGYDSNFYTLPNSAQQQQPNWVNPNPEFTPWRSRIERGLPEPSFRNGMEIMEDTEPHHLLQDQSGYLGSKHPPPYPRQENYRPSKSKDK